MENGHQYVEEILKRKYHIPKYQRGYRWTGDNVKKLLEDIYEGRLYESGKDDYLNENSAYNIFYAVAFDWQKEVSIFSIPKCPYCIQPLVVMESKGAYDVIDGQQRLTTIAIIRAALKKSLETLVSKNSQEVLTLVRKETVGISYESRQTSKIFLQYLYGMEKKPQGENIDYDHMQQAFDVSKSYFDEQLKKFEDDKVRKKYADYLDDVLCKNTQFIWYEVKDHADPQKVFANFNTGKIELTNAELIKALFMNPSNYNSPFVKDKQIVISEKWDEIENKLHEPEFWAFVPHMNQYETASRQYSTRIDVIFDFLIMEHWLETNQDKCVEDYISWRNLNASDKYIFNEVESWINSKLSDSSETEAVMEQCWRRVGKIFSGLKELYSGDSRIYNTAGLYINLCNRRSENVDEYEKDNYETYLYVYHELSNVLNLPRNEREDALKKLVRYQVFQKGSDIERTIKGIRYNEGKSSDIIKVLLVYNIALLSSSKGTGERFNFLENARNKWEREHIFASNVKTEVNIKGLQAMLDCREVLDILCGDDYMNYVKYLFDTGDRIEFTHEGNGYVLDLSSDTIDEEIRDFFIDANRSSDGNGRNVSFARALRAKREAEYLRECCKKISEIGRIFREEGELKKLLAYQYVSSFEGNFHFVENIDFTFLENCEATIITAVLPDIEFTSAEFTYTCKEYLENKDHWTEWLFEGDEEGRTNYMVLLETIRDHYQSKLEGAVYKRTADNIRELKDISEIFDGVNDRFIFAALELNRITLEKKIDEFFKKNFQELMKDNSMGNMTLLTGSNQRGGIENNIDSRGQNQLVSDKAYCEKKKIVYEFYKSGQFVPIGTLLVFTDQYTQERNAAKYWLPNSRLKYLKDMIRTISGFLGESEGAGNE